MKQPQPPAEADLVRRAQSGDLDAFDELIKRYLVVGRVMAMRLMHHAQDAEDLLQDAFLRALRYINTVDPERGFGPWFKRLIVNLAFNAREARALRVTEVMPTDVATFRDTPDLLTERAELRLRIRSAIGELPPRQRLIVMMYEVDGATTAEIADLLEVSQETVRWHLHRARTTLREALAVFRS